MSQIITYKKKEIINEFDFLNNLFKIKLPREIFSPYITKDIFKL